MEENFFGGKIGMNTCFAYIYVSNGPMDDVSFYVPANEPVDIVAHLFKNYVICLADSVCEAGWDEQVDIDKVAEIMQKIEADGKGESLLPIMKLIHKTPENPNIAELKAFCRELRPIVDALGGAMDFSVCCNIIEFLQFLRQYDGDITVAELFEDYLNDAELDCGIIE